MATSDGFQKSADVNEKKTSSEREQLIAKCEESFPEASELVAIFKERLSEFLEKAESFPKSKELSMFMESSKMMLMKYGRCHEMVNELLVVYKETDMVPAAAIRCQLEVVEGQITQLKRAIGNLEDEISGRGIPWVFYSMLEHNTNSDDVINAPESKAPESKSNEEVILNNSSYYGFSRSQLLAVFSLALFSALFVIFDLQSLVF